MHFQLKMLENGRKNMFREKKKHEEVTADLSQRYSGYGKIKNSIFGLCQQTRKVECM